MGLELRFHDAPCGFLITDPDGLIEQVNSRFAAWTGFTADELVGRQYFEDLLTVGSRIYYQTHFAPTLGLQGMVRDVALELSGCDGRPVLAIANAEVHQATITLPAAQFGDALRQVVRAASTDEARPILTDAVHVWMVLIDATERRAFEQASQRKQRRLARLQTLTSAFAVASTHQEVVSVVVAEVFDGLEGDHGFLADIDGDGLRILEALPADAAALGAWEVSDIPSVPMLAESLRSNTPLFVEHSDEIWSHLPLLRTDGVATTRVALLPMATAGRAMGVLCVASSTQSTFQPDERSFLMVFAELTAQSIERARLHDEAVIRALQVAFLAELSAELDEATSFDQRAQRLVNVLVPAIADFATVEVGRPDNGLIAAAHVNPELVDTLRQLHIAVKPADQPVPLGGALMPSDKREPHVIGEVRSEMFDTGVLSPAQRDLLTHLMPMSYVCLPLVARGALVATLSLFTKESGRRYGPSDLPHLRELAARAALALENARLYDHQRKVAASFQQQLLRRPMPSDARVELASRYQAGGEQVEIGGDFFDAFLVTPDRLAVAVGDVVGRGIPAATVMGQLRTALRAYALEGRGPASTLERLDLFAESIDGAFCSSVAYAELDLDTGELQYSCAGHPPPVLVSPTGQTAPLWEGRSPLLGLDPAAPKAKAVVQVPHGGRLLLYTDGLIETRDRALDDGIADLVTHLSSDRDISLDRLAELVDGHGVHTDDVCMLSLTWRARTTSAQS